MAIKNTTTKRSPESAPAAPTPSGGGDDRITFDAARILCGIAFHLIDDDLTVEVDMASLAVLRTRMERAKIQASVSRIDWQRMTDYDRLHWLMRRGNVSVSHHDGIARLTPRSA